MYARAREVVREAPEEGPENIGLMLFVLPAS